MSLETLIYQSIKTPEYFLRYAKENDDIQLNNLITESMPSNGMILSFERFPSYFKATRAQYNTPEIMLIYHKDQSDVIVGMMNIGWKECFINGEVSKIRYAADLRIKRNARGKKSLEVFMEYVSTQLPRDFIFQSVVLEDNKIARHLMHQKREGFADAYLYDQITTYTISQVKKPKGVDGLHLVTLSEATIPDVNHFVDRMKEHYNFLPNYDFSQLKQNNHPFWAGMSLEDFNLILNENEQVVGLFGLWDQKSFKQTKVMKYSTTLKLLRPIYNVLAKIIGLIHLPQVNDSFDYLMCHSALCEPNDQATMHYLIHQAHIKTKEKNKSTYCITIADNDPRKENMGSFKAHKMKAIHGLHSFGADPKDYFDREKISYFEVGRI